MKFIDMFSALALLASSAFAVGEDCIKKATLWDQTTCAIKADTAKYQSLCTPIRLFPGGVNSYSTLSAGKVKGIIMLYHGYTACPDANSALAARLQSEGYVVLAPLNVGHGINRGYGCTGTTCVTANDNPSFLPTSKQPYVDFIDWSLRVLAQEASLIPAAAKASGFFIGTGGLSLGGAMATLSASRPGTPVQRTVLVNPFYTVSNPGLDYKLVQCQASASPDTCLFGTNKNFADAVNAVLTPNYGNLTLLINLASAVSPELNNVLHPKVLSAANVISTYPNIMNVAWKAFDTIAETPSLISNTIFDSPYEWGAACIQVNTQRGGYCTTRARNLVAIHNFGSYAISQSRNIPITTKVHIIFSERDGYSRDTLVSTLSDKLKAKGNPVTKCNFLMSCALNSLVLSDNSCGAPHSIFSRVENQVIKPFNLYWETGMLNSIAGFYNGAASFVSTGTTNDVCSSTGSKYLGQFSSMGPSFFTYAYAR